MINSSLCSVLAQQANAPLYGSAAQVDCWLLLEYPNNWHAKALIDNALPTEVNRHLAQLPAEVARLCGKKLRVLFVKQSTRSQIIQPRVILAAGSSLLCCELTDYDAVKTIRAEHIAKHFLPDSTALGSDIYLVCTNGQRDICCGRFGIPLYKTLQAEFGDRIWQTSHIGGHRFAPNLLCLPSGLSYGFVQPQEAKQLVTQHDAGLMSLKHLRGRSHYPAPVQAAEYFLRKKLELLTRETLTLVSMQNDKQQCSVLFEHANRRYSVCVSSRIHAHNVIASCGASAKPVDEFYLEEITTA